MNNLDFMRDAPSGFTLICIRPLHGDFSTHEIENVNLQLIEQASSDLAARAGEAQPGSYAFNKGATSSIDIEGHSKASIICLLRYIYLHDYLLSEDLHDRPCSILLHFQMYKLADLLKIPALKTQAYRYALRECEHAVSAPPVVIDLVDAIRFLYVELQEADELFDVIVNYCLECYGYHKLGTNLEFQQTIYEAPDFHRLLIKRSSERGFESDGAMDIIQAKVCPYPEHFSFNREERDCARFFCYLHNRDVTPVQGEKRSIWRQPTEIVLVHRPRFPTGAPRFEDVDESGDEGVDGGSAVASGAAATPFILSSIIKSGTGEPSDPGPSRGNINDLDRSPHSPPPRVHFHSPPARSIQVSPPPYSYTATPEDKEDQGQPLTVKNFSAADLADLARPEPDPYDHQRFGAAMPAKPADSTEDLSAEPPKPYPFAPHPDHSRPVPHIALRSALHALAAQRSSQAMPFRPAQAPVQSPPWDMSNVHPSRRAQILEGLASASASGTGSDDDWEMV